MADPSAPGAQHLAQRNEVLASLRERYRNELQPNLFGIVINHGLPCWVRRSTWGNTIACVTDIENVERGRPPYFNGAKVRADIYRISTGEILEEGAVLPVPGTFKTWEGSLVEPPPW